MGFLKKLNNDLLTRQTSSKNKIRTILISAFFLTSISTTIEAAETVAPADPTWGLDPVTGTLLVPGIVVNTLGRLETPRSAADGDNMLTLFDTRSATLAANRPVQTPDSHIHHNWDIGSIGNVFGLAIDNDRNIYTTASVHYGSFFGFVTGNEADISFGSIGAGDTPDTDLADNNPGTLNDLSAAGAVYKIDKITGDVSLFASLPQTAHSFTQQGCEANNDIPRNTGPSLGNIAYDRIHNQLFISNFEDGTIYRYDASTPVPAGGYTAANALSVFQPTGFTGLVPDGTTTTGTSPYGLAVDPSGTKLYFGTNEINTNPQLFSIDLDPFGDFSGSEVNQNATLGTDLDYTQNVGGAFVNNGNWVSYSDLQFSPAGELIVGIRTGCNSNLATSHNHGGAYYLLKQDASGLYNTPADKVPGNNSPSGSGNYDAGSIPIYTNQFSDVGRQRTGPDDGYGGVAIYDKGDGSFDFLVTSSDMTVENGPHGFMLFNDDFTIDTNAANLVSPLASFPSLSSSTTASTAVDYKGIGGDIEVLSTLVDWGDAPDTYSTDLITGNSLLGTDVKGPTHILTSDGIILGTTVDFEFNGAASINAQGDDNASTPDDEDGISAFPALPAGTTSYTIPIANITAANSSGGDVTIHAWIDFDGNGTFDASEYTTTTVVNGDLAPNADLEWTGITGVTGNTTYARFRITNDPAINANTPAGPAINGEVEDYAINVVSIGSIVWNDSNSDGIQTAGESGIAGAQVLLLDAAGNPIAGVAPQTTESDGLYHFSGLPEGDYKVQVFMPDGYIPTINQATGDNNDTVNDSDIDDTSGNVHTSGTYTLDLGLEPSVDSNIVSSDDADNSEESNGNMTVDFGFVELGSWSGNVSQDTNNDDIGDINLNNVEIKLFNDTNDDGIPDNTVPVATTTTGTDNSGNYSFTGLVPGNYVAVETQPIGLINVSENEGGLDDDQNGTTVANNNIISGTISSGENDANNDFVEELPGSWSGNVSRDDNNDNTGDTNLSGVPVTLYLDVDNDGTFSTGDTLIGTENTGTDGNYSFTNLAPGNYVAVETQPTGLLDVSENEGGLDNDKPNNSVLNSIAGTVDAGENDANNDFVEELPGSWSGNVSRDDNNDNTGDTNLSGVPVTLYLDVDNDGTFSAVDILIGTENTGNDGNYSFTNLAPGNYVAVETQPAGLLDVSENEGGADNDKPNNNILNSIAGTVGAGEADLNNDFVEELPGSWSGTVTEDIDNDGAIDDTDDSPISGVTITLYVDDNNDGIHQVTETTVAGSDTTDSLGNYTISNIAPDDYVAVQTQPIGFIDVTEDEGGADDDKTDNSVVNSIAGTVSSGENDANNDFVEIRAASLGDTVWFDNNGNGIQDTGELGVDNVTVYLLDDSGTRIPGEVETTNASGFYEFTDLAPVTYSVEFDLTTLPSGYEATIQDATGSNEVNDSDADSSTGITDPVTIIAGQNNPNLDLGIFQQVSIGSTVFIDRNNNGLQDADEGGIEGMTLQLFNAGDDPTSDTALQEVDTDVNGDYLFGDLLPGSYFVYIPTPLLGAPASSTDIGTSTTDNQIDGDDNGQQTASGEPVQSPNITLSIGTEPTDGTGINSEIDTGPNTTGKLQDNSLDANGDMTVDFGFVPASIGDTIWHDVDYSFGTGPNAGDIPLANVIVTLTPPPGVDAGAGIDVELTTTTDANGNYLFELLPPGEYNITVDTTTGDLGANSDLDIFVDPDSIKDSVSTFDLGSAEQNLDQDFAYAELGGVSGNVSEDIDNDGIGDVPLANVTLQLLDDQGDPILENGNPVTTTTDDEGNYSFTGLIPGDFQIAQIQPTGFASVSDVDGGDQNNLIGDVTPIGVTAGNIVPAQDFVERLSPTEIPTLSEWALILLMMLLGLIGYRQSNIRSVKRRTF